MGCCPLRRFAKHENLVRPQTDCPGFFAAFANSRFALVGVESTIKARLWKQQQVPYIW
jgi:hypothetical protein